MQQHWVPASEQSCLHLKAPATKTSIAIMLFLFSSRTKHYRKSSFVRQRRKVDSPCLREPKSSLTFSDEFHFFKSSRYWTCSRTGYHLQPLFDCNTPDPLLFCRGVKVSAFEKNNISHSLLPLWFKNISCFLGFLQSDCPVMNKQRKLPVYCGSPWGAGLDGR